MVHIPVTEYITATPRPSFFTLTAPPKPPPALVSNNYTSILTSSYNIDSDQMAEMQEISDLLLQDMVHLNAMQCKRGLEVFSIHFLINSASLTEAFFFRMNHCPNGRRRLIVMSWSSYALKPSKDLTAAIFVGLQKEDTSTVLLALIQA